MSDFLEIWHPSLNKIKWLTTRFAFAIRTLWILCSAKIKINKHDDICIIYIWITFKYNWNLFCRKFLISSYNDVIVSQCTELTLLYLLYFFSTLILLFIRWYSCRFNYLLPRCLKWIFWISAVTACADVICTILFPSWIALSASTDLMNPTCVVIDPDNKMLPRWSLIANERKMILLLFLLRVYLLQQETIR